MLNDEQLAKLADVMEHNEKYTKEFFNYDYAKLALVDRIDVELNTPGCASRLAGTFGSKAKLNYPWLKPQESRHVITLRVKFVVHVSNLVIVTGSTSTT